MKLLDENNILIENCFEVLNKKSPYSKSIIKEYKHGFSKPPYEFYLKFNIPVHKIWNYGNYNTNDLELLIRTLYYCDKIYLKNLYLKIIKLNPELKTIKIRDNKKEYYHVLMGCVSYINLSDIMSFCNGNVGFVMRYHSNRLETKLSNLLPNFIPLCDIQWVMSLKTIKFVEDTIKQFNSSYV